MKKTNTKNSAKAPKAKEVKVKKEKVVAVPKYELLTFSVKATIPTQMYGNIMPEIVVKAKTIEDAKAVVMPAIESLYIAYAEKNRDGSVVSIMSKASVTATEKIVDVPAPAAPATAPKTVTPPPATPAPAPATAKSELDEFVDDLKKSPAFTKAENAVKNCTSEEALGMIEKQIQASEKLTADEKPVLLTQVLKKRKDFVL